MNERLRRWAWPLVKALLAVAIVGAVGWQFWGDLHREQLQQLSLQVPWLVLSALLYLAGLGFAAWYWYRLLVVFGERPALPAALRAYYLSQLGKYLPGKAWALMMRGTLICGPDVKLGVALIATFYEVLTMMAAGALLAAVLLALDPPALLSATVDPHWLGLFLAAVCGIPLLPAVFNRLVARLAKRFQRVESFRLPHLRALTLMEGLATTGVGWCLFGVSLWAMVHALLPDAPPLTWVVGGRYIAIQALAWVAGFVAVFVPGGFGVREWVLKELLGPELAGQGAAKVIVIVLLVRLTGMAAELVVAAVIWWLPGPRRTSA
jgi:glycosyltransferase 2 family protein